MAVSAQLGAVHQCALFLIIYTQNGSGSRLAWSCLRIDSDIKTRSVSREGFDVDQGLGIVRLVPAQGDWLQPQVQKAVGKPRP